jgi:hypothetical protein
MGNDPRKWRIDYIGTWAEAAIYETRYGLLRFLAGPLIAAYYYLSYLKQGRFYQSVELWQIQTLLILLIIVGSQSTCYTRKEASEQGLGGLYRLERRDFFWQ